MLCHVCNKVVFALFCKFGVNIMKHPVCIRVTYVTQQNLHNVLAYSIFFVCDLLGNNQAQIPKIINIDQGEMSHA